MPDAYRHLDDPDELAAAGRAVCDPVWRLPLHQP
jgi:leucyl aminopeptidase